MSGRMWSICWTFPPGGNRRGNRKSHDNRFSPLLFFSVPTERAAITAGDDLRGLGICHQQAFWQEYRKGIPAKIRNLTEDCIACNFAESPAMRVERWPALCYTLGRSIRQIGIVTLEGRICCEKAVCLYSAGESG